MSKKIITGLFSGFILWSIINLIFNQFQKSQSNNSKKITLEKCIQSKLNNEECKKLISNFRNKLDIKDVKSK